MQLECWSKCGHHFERMPCFHAELTGGRHAHQAGHVVPRDAPLHRQSLPRLPAGVLQEGQVYGFWVDLPETLALPFIVCGSLITCRVKSLYLSCAF